MVLALVITLGTVLGAQGRATAEPVSELVGRWIDAPGSIASGKPVVADWRVNLNDGERPPGNEPVDNVTVIFTVGHATFTEIPDVCLTQGVEPRSAISEDGSTLTCNLGTVDQGTAVAIQTPVNAKGRTGDEVTLGGNIDDQDVALDPIEIVNPFAMDIRWQTASGFRQWNDAFDRVTVDLSWTLFHTPQGDPGPESVTYRLTVTDTNGAPVNRAASVDTGQVGCAEQRRWSSGHPLSGVPADPRKNAPFPSCRLTAVAGRPGQFDLTLSRIDYSQQNVPTLDSMGRPLPTDRAAIAAGSVWFTVITDEPGSIQLRSSAPTYRAPTGQTATDDPGNNSVSKTHPLPGGFSSSWQRQYTQSGGVAWDDTYGLPAGTKVRQGVSSSLYQDDVPANAPYGLCAALDSRYVTFDRAALWNFANDYRFEYYTGNSPLLNPAAGNTRYNPDQFDCGIADGWSTALPADLSRVRAVRVRFPHSEYAASQAENQNTSGLGIYVFVDLKTGLAPGQDVWSFGSMRRNGRWAGPEVDQELTPTPDARYRNTNGRRDILRVTTATPAIKKAVERTTVVPGVPVGYTLTYSANFPGQGPKTVDDYKIVDTLPAGLDYVPGSASVQPAKIESVGGRTMITWLIDDVESNREHRLTYQAVANSDTQPGLRLTNAAVSTLGDNESEPARATVTTTTNGHTTILKTSDVDYIPNDQGDGVGAGSWTVTIESADPYPQRFTDTIDVLPYNGDQRGTTFAGSYALTEVVAPAGGTVYYTETDPAKINFDPADPSNGAAGDPAGNTVGWTTTKPERPTAIRVIGGELAPGASFAFQVKIKTEGAEPQDVYVNCAQARAEHTELVMRTSASLTVTDYKTVKTSDPVAGATVAPGRKVTYTITVTQQGKVPAGARFTDTLAGVTDDTTYNDDLKADLGEVSLKDGVISWQGTIPVGQAAHVTYSVTVKDVKDLGDGDQLVQNKIKSPGCQSPADCTVIHPVGYFVYSKTSDPEPGAVVGVGDVITYTVQIAQRGEGPVAKAAITDDLSAVLDDATWDDTVQTTSGRAGFTAPTLEWSGSLAIDQVVTLTYTVTVTGDGDFRLANVVTRPDCPSGEPCVPAYCVEAEDGNPDCRTEHTLGDWEIDKQSDPRTGTAVEVGDTITYTVTVRHLGLAPVKASLRDELGKVLDDATWNGDLKATAGSVSYAEPVLTWDGRLTEGDVVTITYSVTTTSGGDRKLKNVVTTDGRCVPAEGQTVACTTEHDLPSPTPSVSPSEPGPTPPVPPQPGLPETGAPVGLSALAGGVLLLLIGGGAMITGRLNGRRRSR